MVYGWEIWSKEKFVLPVCEKFSVLHKLSAVLTGGLGRWYDSIDIAANNIGDTLV